ncbi:hypothetical protein sos41_41080 [Alphaproteobacteria bacterium SO-S41]|nr:hypothetical protein sos41_41080 [Alphaproteobacteria bacterium SO-S41]
MAEPIAPGLIDLSGDGPRLIGGRRKRDGKIVFPLPTGPEAANFDRITLQDRGTLWSYTVQRFRPKSPPYTGDDDERTFKPYALGYVELPDEVIVETRIEIDDFAQLKIGQPMALTLQRFRDDDTFTYAFKPV